MDPAVIVAIVAATVAVVGLLFRVVLGEWNLLSALRKRKAEPLENSAVREPDSVSIRETSHSNVAVSTGGGVNLAGDEARFEGPVAGRDVTSVTNVYQTATPTPTTAQALRQLPRPSDDFTGREAELSQLLDKIQQGGVAISGLRGMGGIGKTALALVLAQKLAP